MAEEVNRGENLRRVRVNIEGPYFFKESFVDYYPSTIKQKYIYRPALTAA